MDDGGISVTGLTIGGAALTTIGGLVGAWLKARHGRTEITPQPLEVRESPAYVRCDDCIERHRVLDKRHDSLADAIKEDRKTLGDQLACIREDLSRNDLKAEERSRNLHRRIDPLVEALGGARQSIDNHLADHRAGHSGGI